MFDINKVKEAANELGLKITLNSPTPGMRFLASDGAIDFVTFDELQESLMLEFKQNSCKEELRYEIKSQPSFTINISSTKEMTTKVYDVEEIKLNVLGHNKVSHKMELPKKDKDAEKNHYPDSNTEAA